MVFKTREIYIVKGLPQSATPTVTCEADEESYPYSFSYTADWQVINEYNEYGWYVDVVVNQQLPVESGTQWGLFTFTLSANNYESLVFDNIGDGATTRELTMQHVTVANLSDGTESYPIEDSQARSDIASLQTNKVPTTRTVNGKALSSDITLTASDVGALPDSTVIPTVNNATLTIQKNSTNVQTFTANASTNVTANITVPTDTGDLTNGAGFITSSDISNMVTTDTDQNITGVKTYINPPIFSIQTYTAYNTGNTDTPYKKIASCVMTGANQTTSIPFIFCVSHASVSSGTYNGKILFRTSATAGTISTSNSGVVLNGNPDFISNGNIVFYLMYKNNYPNSNKVTFEVWVYVKNTYQGVCIMPLRIGTGTTGTQNISLVTWGNDAYATLPSGYSTINQIIL